MERKFMKSNDYIGRIRAEFKTELYDGCPPLDTEVKFGEECICWISLPDKEKFIKELNDVISKYSI